MYSSIKIKDYKCFVKENDYQGFDDIKPVNVIIGKNNSGKSKLLEALAGIVEGTLESMPFCVKLETTLTDAELLQLFSPLATAPDFPPHSSYWDVIGRHLSGRKIILEKASTDSDYQFILDANTIANLAPYLNIIDSCLHFPLLIEQFKGYRFLHLRAERDINKEKIDYASQVTDYKIESNSTGICSLIARMLNDEQGHTAKLTGNNGKEVNWKQYIENDFLSLLNEVVAPEITFKRIYTLTGANNLYEIYLEEDKKGGIKLSDCGSGLKTIIATLTLLHTVPRLSNNYKNIFAFEELENNLHPSLERKLLKHIKKYSVRYPDSLIFLTTHSNVAIDLFGKDINAQIVRICNDGCKSTVEPAMSEKAKQTLLDDLGFKASDLLQSNCVIWVEGPSDRIYIKKWLELFGGNDLEEGLDYQFLYYGGTLLSHYTANVEEKKNTDSLIEMLKINRHSYVVMDSDKKSSEDQLKDRVKRIQKEFSNAHWVTAGKEIENYLPTEALHNYFDSSLNVEQFSFFHDIYKNIKKVETFDKVKFALDITKNKNYTKENLAKCLDLHKQTEMLIDFIRKSNQEIC